MNAEFFAAIEDIEKEKGIPKGYMLEKINQALLAALKKDNPAGADAVKVEVDEAKKKIELYIMKTVVEEVENPATELTEEAARKIMP
jgi:N utilization substance protein A